MHEIDILIINFPKISGCPVLRVGYWVFGCPKDGLVAKTMV